VQTCRECFEEYVNGPAREDDGFCSDACKNTYDAEIAGVKGDDL
jgi:hypothetical protein